MCLWSIHTFVIEEIWELESKQKYSKANQSISIFPIFWILYGFIAYTVKHDYYEFQGTPVLVRYKCISYYAYNEF